MKAAIEIDFTVDGFASNGEIIAALSRAIQGSVITSEDMGDGDRYAIMLDSFSVVLK